MKEKNFGWYSGKGDYALKTSISMKQVFRQTMYSRLQKLRQLPNLDLPQLT